VSTAIDFRAMRGAEFTAEAQAALDELLARTDLPDLRGKTSRMTVCPCARYGEGHGCDVTKLPVHVTCGPGVNDDQGGCCWTWTGCDDPDCDHPACDSKGWRDFSAWYADTFDAPSYRLGDGILLWTTEWKPWLEANKRHPELIAEAKRGGKDPARLLKALERGPLYPVKLGTDYLDMEIELHLQGVPLEERDVAETSIEHLAYRVCRGETDLPTGGTMTSELRLARALDLADAPEGYQGSLFG